MLPDSQMLGAFLLADAALFAVHKGLALLLKVILHHVPGMVFQAVYIIVGIHLEDARDVDPHRAGLAVFADGRIVDICPFFSLGGTAFCTRRFTGNGGR